MLHWLLVLFNHMPGRGLYFTSLTGCLASSMQPWVGLTMRNVLFCMSVQAYREWDFSNMLTVLLRFNGRAVAAAVVRVFGTQLAELPLVATRPDARRLGHARVLVRAIEATLIELGVQVCVQQLLVMWQASCFRMTRCVLGTLGGDLMCAVRDPDMKQ